VGLRLRRSVQDAGGKREVQEQKKMCLKLKAWIGGLLAGMVCGAAVLPPLPVTPPAPQAIVQQSPPMVLAIAPVYSNAVAAVTRASLQVRWAGSSPAWDVEWGTTNGSLTWSTECWPFYQSVTNTRITLPNAVVGQFNYVAVRPQLVAGYPTNEWLYGSVFISTTRTNLVLAGLKISATPTNQPFALLAAPSLMPQLGPWALVARATNSVFVSAAGQQEFFRATNL
jgi:hypothetical protein